MSGRATQRPRRPRNPELRRQRNMAAFWQGRYDRAAHDPGELASVAFDRARAAARADGRRLYELAQMLSEWAERVERAGTGRHAS